MRRLCVIPVMVAVATCAALLPATGASAKPPTPAITAITGNSAGPVASFCDFNVVVSYASKAKKGDTVGWTIRRATDNSSLGGIVPLALGPSPFTPTGLVLQVPAGSYYFDVQLLAKGSVLSEQTTGTFTTTGTCPAAGPVASYP